VDLNGYEIVVAVKSFTVPVVRDEVGGVELRGRGECWREAGVVVDLEILFPDENGIPTLRAVLVELVRLRLLRLRLRLRRRLRRESAENGDARNRETSDASITLSPREHAATTTRSSLPDRPATV
jgi:hypothetical protein